MRRSLVLEMLLWTADCIGSVHIWGVDWSAVEVTFLSQASKEKALNLVI